MDCGDEKIRKFIDFTKKLKDYFFDVPPPVKTEKYVKYWKSHPEAYEDYTCLYKDPVVVVVGGESKNPYLRAFFDEIDAFIIKNSLCVNEYRNVDFHDKELLHDEQFWYVWNMFHKSNIGNFYEILAEIDLSIIGKDTLCINEDEDWLDIYKVYGHNYNYAQYTEGTLSTHYHGSHAKTIRNNFIFWNIFLAYMDREVYDNELQLVIDMAYLVGFDEMMIRDWCKAVKHALQGNCFSKDSALDFETREARQFFLHDFSDNNDTDEYTNHIRKLLEKFWFIVGIAPLGCPCYYRKMGE